MKYFFTLISLITYISAFGQVTEAPNNCGLIEITDFPPNANIFFKNVNNIPFVCLQNQREIAIYKISVNAHKIYNLYLNKDFNERIKDFYSFKNKSKEMDIAFITEENLLLIRNNKIFKYIIPREFIKYNFDRISIIADNVVVLYNKNPDVANKKIIGALFKLKNKKLIPFKKYHIKTDSSDLLTVYSHQNSVLINDNIIIVAELSNKSLSVNGKYFMIDNVKDSIISEINKISKLYKLDPTIERLNQLDKLDVKLSRNINVFADQMYIYKVSKGKVDSKGSAALALDVYDKFGKTITIDSFAFFLTGEWPNWLYEYRITKNDFPLNNIAFKNYLITNGHIFSILELPRAYNPNGKSIMEINKEIYTSRLDGNTKRYIFVKRIPGLTYIHE